MTCNMNKIFNTRKDEEDEPPNAPGVHIGPVAKEARDKAAKEFNEGIKEITHMTISKYSAQNLNIPSKNKVEKPSQCGNCRNSSSHFFRKNSVKAMFLLKS